MDEMSEDQKAELKKDLNERTLVGEYVGAADLQHVVAYEKETIIFFAIVENNCPNLCLLPEKTT